MCTRLVSICVHRSIQSSEHSSLISCEEPKKNHSIGCGGPAVESTRDAAAVPAIQHPEMFARQLSDLRNFDWVLYKVKR